MSESMVERVARAIMEADIVGTSADFPDTPASILRLAAEALFEAHHIPMARAAIEALREPTEAMDFAGQCGKYQKYGGATTTWKAMIDAALT